MQLNNGTQSWLLLQHLVTSCNIFRIYLNFNIHFLYFYEETFHYSIFKSRSSVERAIRKMKISENSEEYERQALAGINGHEQRIFSERDDWVLLWKLWVREFDFDLWFGQCSVQCKINRLLQLHLKVMLTIAVIKISLNELIRIWLLHSLYLWCNK